MEDFMEKCIIPNIGCSNNVVAEGGLDDGNAGQTGSTGSTGATGSTGDPDPDTKPIVSAVGSVVGSDTSDLTVVPGSHFVDDFEILACETDDETVTLTTANGFSALGSAVSASGETRITLFSRTWDGSAGSPVVARGSTNHVICNITSFDHGTVSATGTSSETTADTSGVATLPSGTDGLFVLFAANALPNSNQANQITPGGTATELVDQANTAGNGGLLYAATNATPSGDFTYTTSIATAKAHILLRLT